MSQSVSQTVAIFGLISTFLVGLALLVIVGVGAAYNPDEGQLYLVIFASGALIIAAAMSFLVIKGLLRKRVPRALELLIVIFGLILALYGMYLVATDFGDILLYIWLVPMGASLSIVAFDESLSNRRDT